MKNKLYEIYSKEIFSPLHGYPTAFRGIMLIAFLKLRKIKNRIKYGKAGPDPFEVLEVDPSLINNQPAIFVDKTKKYHSLGAIKDGDWDKGSEEDIKEIYKRRGYLHIYQMYRYDNFFDTKFHKALEDRFEHDKEWEETDYPDFIRENSFKFDKVSELEYLDKLFQSVKQNGLIRKKNLKDSSFSKGNFDDVMVHIGREGSFFIVDNKHRLSFAEILDLEKIPVRVCYRHKIWQDKRNKVLKHNEVNDELKNHPDIKNLIERY